MLPVDLLIFDLDGTLVDTLEDITASVNYTLSRIGRRSLTKDAVRRFVGDGIEMLMVRALGGEARGISETVAICKEHHRRNFLVRSRLYPFVRETLDHFHPMPMAVISNKATEFAVPLLDGLGIARFFKLIIGADAGLPLKPEPDAIIKVVTDLGAAKERTIMIGDGNADVLSGRAAGVHTCAVTYGFRTEEELREYGPDYMIGSFSELTNLFIPDR